jgi:hypothetical protein
LARPHNPESGVRNAKKVIVCRGWFIMLDILFAEKRIERKWKGNRRRCYVCIVHVSERKGEKMGRRSMRLGCLAPGKCQCWGNDISLLPTFAGKNAYMFVIMCVLILHLIHEGRIQLVVVVSHQPLDECWRMRINTKKSCGMETRELRSGIVIFLEFFDCSCGCHPGEQRDGERKRKTGTTS